MPDIRFAPVRPGSLSGRIAGEIREALFSGKIRSGDFLGTEASLAQEFGVSRMASRDALRSLAATGIVEVRQGTGASVSWITFPAIVRKPARETRWASPAGSRLGVDPAHLKMGTPDCA